MIRPGSWANTLEGDSQAMNRKKSIMPAKTNVWKVDLIVKSSDTFWIPASAGMTDSETYDFSLHAAIKYTRVAT
jgi:hypothetical protein